MKHEENDLLKVSMQKLIIDSKWMDFPPTEDDKERLRRYAVNQALYDSEHQDVFPRAMAFLSGENPTEAIYIVANFLYLLSNKTADAQYSEDIVFSSPSENKTLDDVYRGIYDRSNLGETLRDGAVQASMKGDKEYKVRYTVYPEDPERTGAYIDVVPPEYYFAEFDPSNIKDPTMQAFAYQVEVVEVDPISRGEKIKTYLFKEIHKPGYIKNEQWEMTDKDSTGPRLISTSGWVATGFPGMLLFHVANQSLSRYWGQDDYKPLYKLQDALNNAWSRYERVLDKHSEPILVVPPGTLTDEPFGNEPIPLCDLNPDQRGRLQRYLGDARYGALAKQTKVFEAADSEEGSKLPRFVEHNGASLDIRGEEIDKIIEHMMMISETNPTVLGIESSGQIESGYALSIRTSGFRSKVRRRMQPDHYALQKAMYAAAYLEHINKGTPKPDGKPNITWPSGMPADNKEEVEIASKAYSSKLMSHKRAVAKAQPDLEGEALDKEVAAIKAEEDEAIEKMARAAAETYPDDTTAREPDDDELAQRQASGDE